MSTGEHDTLKNLEEGLRKAFEELSKDQEPKKPKKDSVPDDLDIETLLDMSVAGNPKPKRKKKG